MYYYKNWISVDKILVHVQIKNNLPSRCILIASKENFKEKKEKLVLMLDLREIMFCILLIASTVHTCTNGREAESDTMCLNLDETAIPQKEKNLRYSELLLEKGTEYYNVH